MEVIYMSMKTWQKIDRFYPLLLFVLILLAVLVVYTFRGIFSTMISAYEVDQGLQGAKIRVNNENLDKASKIITEEKYIPLEVAR